MKETEVNILPIGELNEKVLSLLLEALPFKAKKLPRAEIPSGAYNPRRGQYLALHFLELAHSFRGIVLGVTNVDIYAEGLNFIFGQAELNGKAAVISTYRLENADKELFVLRMVKESVHELGHIFGLEHCSKELCVMKFSNCIEDTDRKGKWYCNECESKLKRFSNARLRFKRNACYDVVENDGILEPKKPELVAVKS
ncbi:MAG: archaemetzincin family Zn-dependent metalloprotease [Candidatus Thermoplasmatota archaeon]|nr:archaemetzincin family Zn-dependent metalloprotease [Candidatus Thermoplasmatota archaeon]